MVREENLITRSIDHHQDLLGSNHQHFPPLLNEVAVGQQKKISGLSVELLILNFSGETQLLSCWS